MYENEISSAASFSRETFKKNENLIFALHKYDFD